MKIVKASAELVWVTPNAAKIIEEAGRICYKSTGNSPRKFIRMLIKRGHLSVLEHASASFRFTTDRGVTHEMVRHRLAAYSQESTRYVKYQDIEVIEPPDLNEGLDEWKAHMFDCEYRYNQLLQKGVKPQIARSVLPNSLKTEIVMTCNFREWLHVFKLRCHHTAHPQIVEIMEYARRILQLRCPEVFNAQEID